MNDRLRVEEIKKLFKNKTFTTDELYKFYLYSEPNLKKSTFGWRVYTLKKNGVINNIKRGLYEIKNKKDFEPTIKEKIYEIYKSVKNEFPYTDICIWETAWLNNYMIHQPITNYIIVEAEKEASRAIFSFLQESMENIYLNPKKYEVEIYILSGERNIIVRNLTKSSPIEQKGDIDIPSIEKIMVDLFIDDELFVTYQGEELKNIYKELFINFNINQSTLKQYAHKRHVKDKLIKFLKEETDINNNKLYI